MQLFPGAIIRDEFHHFQLFQVFDVRIVRMLDCRWVMERPRGRGDPNLLTTPGSLPRPSRSSEAGMQASTPWMHPATSATSRGWQRPPDDRSRRTCASDEKCFHGFRRREAKYALRSLYFFAKICDKKVVVS